MHREHGTHPFQHQRQRSGTSSGKAGAAISAFQSDSAKGDIGLSIDRVRCTRKVVGSPLASGRQPVMFLYRDEKFMLPEPDSRLWRGDEAMVITHSRNIEKLHQRWSA